MTIPAREDQLDELKSRYSIQMQALLAALQAESVTAPQKLSNEYHGAGVALFNAFERTLDEYSLPEFQISQDIINRKGEDALNLVPTIIGHWKLLRRFSQKFNLSTPTPSTTSYASLQRVIKKCYPSQSDAIRTQFLEGALPVHGFDHASQHTGWKMKPSVSVPLVLGGLCFITGLILVFAIPVQTGTQYLFIRALLGLGVAGLAVGGLTGSVKLEWTLSTSLQVTAIGGMAILLFFYLVNPPSPPNPNPAQTPQSAVK